jgi:hypothetical protein
METQKLRTEVIYFRSPLACSNRNFPNAAGTWKFGSGLPVGCQAK